MKSRYLCCSILCILLFCAPLTVLASRDVAVLKVDAADGTYAPGDTLPIEITIKDYGDDGGRGLLVWYASTDSTISTSDIELGSGLIFRDPSPPNTSIIYRVNQPLPASIADGSYFIGARIDTDDSNNANNTGVDNTAVTVTSPAAAELELFEVHIQSGSYPQGEIISILARVRNTGTAASGPFTVQYYASTDSSISTQDRLMGTENRGSVPAGETNPTHPINVRIPRDLAPGTYFIGAIVDFNDSNSADNINVAPNTITVTDSDAFEINIGLNDIWRSTDIRGQGFFINVFPNTFPNRPYPVMFVGWFTYDLERPAQGVTATLGEPGQRWLTAYGTYSGHIAWSLEIELTQGGIFDSGVPAPTGAPYGTMTIWFNSCSEGVIDYDIPSVPVSGRIIITRVANDRVALCEELADP